MPAFGMSECELLAGGKGDGAGGIRVLGGRMSSTRGRASGAGGVGGGSRGGGVGVGERGGGDGEAGKLPCISIPSADCGGGSLVLVRHLTSLPVGPHLHRLRTGS